MGTILKAISEITIEFDKSYVILGKFSNTKLMSYDALERLWEIYSSHWKQLDAVPSFSIL